MRQQTTRHIIALRLPLFRKIVQVKAGKTANSITKFYPFHSKSGMGTAQHGGSNGYSRQSVRLFRVTIFEVSNGTIGGDVDFRHLLPSNRTLRNDQTLYRFVA